MKKVIKFGCLGIIGLSIIMFIATLIFSNSEEKNSQPSKLDNQSALIKKSELIKLIEEEKYIQVNNEILKLKDSILIDSLRLVIKNWHTKSVSTIDSEIKTLKNKCYTEHDEFKNITWYYPKSKKGTYRNRVYAYFGIKNETVYNPRLTIKYYGDDWLFWNKAVFLIDGISFNYTLSSKPNRDNNSGKVWETSDENITDSKLNIIQQTFTAKEVKYRLIGKQYHKDFKLSKTRINEIRDILKLNFLIKNKGKIENLSLN